MCCEELKSVQLSASRFVTTTHAVFMKTPSTSHAIVHKSPSEEDSEAHKSQTKNRIDSTNWIRTKPAQQASSQRKSFSHTSSTRQQNPRIMTIGLLAAIPRTQKEPTGGIQVSKTQQ